MELLTIFFGLTTAFILIDNYKTQKELLDLIDENLETSLKVADLSTKYEKKIRKIEDIIIKAEEEKELYAETVAKIKKELLDSTTPVNSEGIGLPLRKI